MSNPQFKLQEINFDTNNLLGLLERYPCGFLLESSFDQFSLGRYSFFGVDPFLTIEFKDGIISEEYNGKKKVFKGNVFERLRFLLNKYSIKGAKSPFCGGAVGFFSYDLGFSLETIKRKNADELKVPDLWFGFFDTVLVIDHYENKSFVASRSGKCRNFLKEFKSPLPTLQVGKGAGKLESNFRRSDYLRAVKKALGYIKKGDIYQLNLSQRFHGRTELSSEGLYANLKKNFPVPFGGILKTKDFSIISASPERFLHCDGSVVSTRPMKGTIRRSDNVVLDRRYKKILEKSPKDKAELLMVVDLERNDLGRVCDYGSVKVESLRDIEEYQGVFQATSQVKGQLYPFKDRIDVIKACFPGGSITGCPKIRAMQIIEELEPHRRGIYTGSMGYFGFNGTMDFNVLIRSFFKRGKDVYFGVGGGIVSDSDPQGEYEETLLKAEALKKALKCST